MNPFRDVVPWLERNARMARAELRQLEQDVGQSASADGRYWLERTSLLEHVADTAKYAVATGNLGPLKDDLEALRTIRAPACNVNDHEGRG